MKKSKSQKNLKPNKIQRQRDPIPWRYCFLTVICGLILVTGFFFAARQHFSAIELGIQNAKLRQQKDELENIQRQLNVTKETALSPVAIKKAAKKIGLQDFASSGMQVVSSRIEEAAASAKKLIDQKATEVFSAKMTLGKKENSMAEKDSKDTKSKTQDMLGDNIRPRVVAK